MAESNSVSSITDASWQQTWGSQEFIERWATKGGWQAPIREMQTAMVLRMIPQPVDAPIRILDIGAGYGALAMAVLHERPNASAVCLDASEAMLNLGKERNADLRDRISFVQASLENPDWVKFADGKFDAVISARALHHFTDNQRRRFIFKEVFGLLRPGGCFINADNVRAPTKELTERYRKARLFHQTVDSWQNQFDGGARGNAEHLSRAAQQRLSRRGACLAQSSWVCRRGLFLEVCDDRSVRRF
jgi:ubiquinone/menaquinone biosynthesis C-methylase UbiE